MTRQLLLWLMLTLCAMTSQAQMVTGVVTDERSGEALPFANVVYDEHLHTKTDAEGRFSITHKSGKLKISMIGYESQTIATPNAGEYQIRLKATDNVISEAVVTSEKKKYSRKNNPAVELMKKVIEAKKQSNLREHDYYSYEKYNKTVLAFSDVNEKSFEEGFLKRFPFLKDHIEVCNETGQLILPVSVDESVVRHIYRKDPESDKTIILAERSNGVNELINSGQMLSTMLKDIFADVNIYEDKVYLLQHQFLSPIATHGAIGFYRYFITDTLLVDRDSCFKVDFTPNNAQDIGFSGSLYITKDSTYRVKRTDLSIPHRSSVNFVDEMRIIQQFEQLESGEQVMVSDDMLVHLKIVDFLQKMQVKRTTNYREFSFRHVPARYFKVMGQESIDPKAHMRDEAYWEKQRSEELSHSEKGMKTFVKRLQEIKALKPIIFVGKAFIENFVETSTNPEKPSKVDIGPVNTIITHNFVNGLRLRASAQTTANLHPQIFLRGYVAYGFRDNKWMGLGEATYSFNKKGYLPREFPVNNLTFTYNRDVMAPSDKFLPTDKDNVFVSFKWHTVDHMMYYEYYRLLWDREWANGLRFKAQLRTQKDEPTAAMFYQSLDGAGAPSQDASLYRKQLRTSDLSVGITYQPGVTWVNTKQRRIPSNHDAPIYGLSHTSGIYEHMGQNHFYHLTEANLYKRFRLASWGKIDAYLKGGVQWSQVPYPLLIMPAANLSYIKEDQTFELIRNMEFLNDRYASLMIEWDLSGKLFNRIPLIKKLKWREFLGCNVLWGMLSDKNNPFLEQNRTNHRLYYFPGRFQADGSYQYLSHVMDPKVPYVEVIAGIHNIFKLLHIEYVHRLTYTDLPGIDKWGIRFMLRVKF